jgi:hypothetical protein
MKFFCELYDSSYNYVKECSSVMRYLNELILKGGVKRVSLLLAISINSNHFFFFFHANRCISRVGLEKNGGYS